MDILGLVGNDIIFSEIFRFIILEWRVFMIQWVRVMILTT